MDLLINLVLQYTQLYQSDMQVVVTA
eukprot:SAG22_NODE_11507_length_481_cov_0.950262_1_plen_25_part_01